MKLNILGMIGPIFSKIKPIFGKIVPMLFGILGTLKTRIGGIVGGLFQKILAKSDKLNKVYMIVLKIKDTLSLVTDKNFKKVFKNPWVIANCVILAVALSMTGVIVMWFKEKTTRLDTALETLDELQEEARKEVDRKKFTIQPFVVREEVEKSKKKIDTAITDVKDVELEEAEDIKALLESANDLFVKEEFEKSVAFYGALAGINSRLIDKGLVNLRAGECYYNLGLYENAIESFRAASMAGGKHKWKSMYLAGDSFIKLRDYENGRKTFFALVALAGKCPPDDIDFIKKSYFNIGDSYLQETYMVLEEKSSPVDKNEVAVATETEIK